MLESNQPGRLCGPLRKSLRQRTKHTMLSVDGTYLMPLTDNFNIQKYLTDEMRYLCLVCSSNRVTHYSLLDGEYIVAHYAGIVKNVSFGSFLRSLLMIGAPSSIE